MKILNTPSLRDIDKKNIKKGPQQKPGDTQLFASELSKSQHETGSYEQEVDDLRKEIEHSGEKLEKEPNLENFKAFRELLSRMAKRINSEAYRLDKIGGTMQNPRYYEIITVINSEADRLYNLIVHEQRNRMAITAKVIGIKGLVVDLIT
jgi:uncharacterized protein